MLVRLFPQHAVTMLQNMLIECNGDPVATIERVLESSTPPADVTKKELISQMGRSPTSPPRSRSPLNRSPISRSPISRSPRNRSPIARSPPPRSPPITSRSSPVSSRTPPSSRSPHSLQGKKLIEKNRSILEYLEDEISFLNISKISRKYILKHFFFIAKLDIKVVES